MKKINVIIAILIAMGFLTACAMDPEVVVRKVYKLQESPSNPYPGNRAQINVTGGDCAQTWYIQLETIAQPMDTNHSYQINFSAAGLTGVISNFYVSINAGSALAYTEMYGTNIMLIESKSNYSVTFTPALVNAPAPHLQFNCSEAPSGSIIDLSDVALYLSTDTNSSLISNGDFSSGETGWSLNVQQTGTGTWSVETN